MRSGIIELSDQESTVDINGSAYDVMYNAVVDVCYNHVAEKISQFEFIRAKDISAYVHGKWVDLSDRNQARIEKLLKKQSPAMEEYYIDQLVEA